MKKARAEALRKEIKEGTDCLDESVAIAKLALHKVRSALTSTALASTALASPDPPASIRTTVAGIAVLSGGRDC